MNKAARNSIKPFNPSGKDRERFALNATPMNPWINKSIATLIALALIIGTFSAAHSLSLSPEDGKFVYNNLANILGFSAIALVFLLRAMQYDIYWISKGRKLKLDERQTQERHEVLEASYKLGAWLVLLNAAWLSLNKAYLPATINNPVNFNVTPGAFFWPFYNIAIALFALPLIVAAFRQK